MPRRLSSSSLEMRKPRHGKAWRVARGLPARKPQGWTLKLGLLIQSHCLWPLPSTPRCPLAVPGSRSRQLPHGEPRSPRTGVSPAARHTGAGRLQGGCGRIHRLKTVPPGFLTSCLPRGPFPGRLPSWPGAGVTSGRGGIRAAGCRRSEERRVGKECLRLCRSRWSPYH